MDGSEIVLSIVTTFISKWLVMNFDATEKWLLQGSHDLWERNRKIVYHKIRNPRAWDGYHAIQLKQAYRSDLFASSTEYTKYVICRPV